MDINTSRIDDEIRKIQERANLLDFFKNERVNILKDYIPKMHNFLAEVNAYGMGIENMYSTHSISDDDYTDSAKLIAHGTFSLRKDYKNKQRLITRLNEAWLKCVKQKDGLISFLVRRVSDDMIVEFQIWIGKDHESVDHYGGA